MSKLVGKTMRKLKEMDHDGWGGARNYLGAIQEHFEAAVVADGGGRSRSWYIQRA